MTVQIHTCYMVMDCLSFLTYKYIQKTTSESFLTVSIACWSTDRWLPLTKCAACREFFQGDLEPCKEVFPGHSIWQGCWLANSFKDYVCALMPVRITWPFACSFFSLSELETDLKVFKETILEILDEEELIEELCLSKWTDPQVLYVYFKTEYFFNSVFCLRRTWTLNWVFPDRKQKDKDFLIFFKP